MLWGQCEIVAVAIFEFGRERRYQVPLANLASEHVHIRQEYTGSRGGELSGERHGIEGQLASPVQREMVPPGERFP